MKCKEIKYYLNDYADGHLIDEIREEIKNHLDVCTECRNYYNDIITIISEARSLPKETTPSRELWEGISERISRRKSPSKIFTVRSDDKYTYEQSGKNLLFKDPRKKRGGWYVIGSAAAAVILGIALGIYFFFQSSSAFWSVERISGTPVIGNEEIKNHGMLEVGEWLETDEKSRARLKVGLIGEVDIQPGSRVKLMKTQQDEHRISLNYGKINAAIWAPPKLFYVETPSATAIDLGCMYTLEVSEDGSSVLKVTSGWVALQSGQNESLIPAGAMCLTKKTEGPGTPYFESARTEFKSALRIFDFGSEKEKTLETVLKEAESGDVLSLWHILLKVKGDAKKKTFLRIAELADIPAGVTLEGIMRDDRNMINKLWESLGYGSMSLWGSLGYIIEN